MHSAMSEVEHHEEEGIPARSPALGLGLVAKGSGSRDGGPRAGSYSATLDEINNSGASGEA